MRARSHLVLQAAMGRGRRRVRRAALALLVAHALPARAASPDAGIRIEGFRFEPQALSVAVGTTVRWENHDDEPHTVTFPDGQTTSPALDTNESWSRRFDAPGTYLYRCALHPQMSGTVTVR